MMTAIGEFSLFLSLVVAAYASAAAWIGWRIQRGEWIRSGENALYGLFGLLTISTAALVYALVTHDFSLAYVVNYSNRTQSMAYTVSALYGGNDGSLLFWAWETCSAPGGPTTSWAGAAIGPGIPSRTPRSCPG